METRYYINSKGELVKKIGRTFFEVNGVHYDRPRKLLTLGFVINKPNKQQRKQR
jgi:hypothetical protein